TTIASTGTFRIPILRIMASLPRRCSGKGDRSLHPEIDGGSPSSDVRPRPMPRPETNLTHVKLTRTECSGDLRREAYAAGTFSRPGLSRRRRGPSVPGRRFCGTRRVAGLVQPPERLRG